MKNAILCCALLACLCGLAPPAAAQVPEQACAASDGDADGVNDCLDQCPASQAGQAIAADGCALPLTIELKGVNFDFGKAELRSDALALLEEAVLILRKYPGLRVELAGHADAIGSERYNLKLSQRRARAVYDYLTRQGIDRHLLVPTAFGESRPVAPNTHEDGSDDSEGRAKNRRVELKPRRAAGA
jgi:OOP family OmpA-OmpF porin